MVTLQISSLIVLIATLLVLIFYTIETYKLRKINAENLELNKALLEPNVIAYFDVGKIHGQLLFILENIGGSPAFLVKAKFDKDFDPADDIFKKNMVESPIFLNGLSDLPPKKQFILDAGLTPSIYEKFGNDISYYYYLISIEFENYNNIKFEKVYNISIEQFIKKATVSEKPKIEQYLDNISMSLKQIANKT